MTELTSKFEDMTGSLVLPGTEKARKNKVFGKQKPAMPQILISVHDEFAPLKAVWQALERRGDCSVFQSFIWLSAWQRHIGTKQGVKPAIVVGWDSEGDALFIFPLGIGRGTVCRTLSWLGGDLCDYHGPLLSSQFSRYVSMAQFSALWADIREILPSHHIVALSRMPARIGGQANPFMTLGAVLGQQEARQAEAPQDRKIWCGFARHA